MSDIIIRVLINMLLGLIHSTLLILSYTIIHYSGEHDSLFISFLLPILITVSIVIDVITERSIEIKNDYLIIVIRSSALVLMLLKVVYFLLSSFTLFILLGSWYGLYYQQYLGISLTVAIFMIILIERYEIGYSDLNWLRKHILNNGENDFKNINIV
jgi:hypothetical protein